MYIFHLWTELT